MTPKPQCQGALLPRPSRFSSKIMDSITDTHTFRHWVAPFLQFSGHQNWIKGQHWFRIAVAGSTPMARPPWIASTPTKACLHSPPLLYIVMRMLGFTIPSLKLIRFLQPHSAQSPCPSPSTQPREAQSASWSNPPMY